MNQKQNSPNNDWWIYRGIGDAEPDPEAVNRLLKVAPPTWRDFDGAVPPKEKFDDEAARREGQTRNNPARGKSYIASDEQREMVNAALYLRRPLLITGKPGTGKSSLASSIAFELGLGPVLRWPITSRSTLVEGLYRYDAIGRLQEAQLRKDATPEEIAKDIGKYLSLGPLGTALLPTERPRVLLIDEIDKGDIDLPNDLLNVFVVHLW